MRTGAPRYSPSGDGLYPLCRTLDGGQYSFHMLLTTDHPDVGQFAAATGWRLEPQGACHGDICVPLPPGSVIDGIVQLGPVAKTLGMAVVVDDQAGFIAVGPASLGGRVLATVDAPDLELPDFDGRPFKLSSLRGTKVVLVAWAPY